MHFFKCNFEASHFQQKYIMLDIRVKDCHFRNFTLLLFLGQKYLAVSDRNVEEKRKAANGRFHFLQTSHWRKHDQLAKCRSDNCSREVRNSQILSQVHFSLEERRQETSSGNADYDVLQDIWEYVVWYSWTVTILVHWKLNDIFLCLFHKVSKSDHFYIYIFKQIMWINQFPNTTTCTDILLFSL